MMHQVTLFEAIALAEKAPSFSAQLAAQNEVECPPETIETAQWAKQARAVYEAMKHGRFMTKAEIAFHSGATEHAVSARLSDLKKLGIRTDKRKAPAGSLYEYRLLPPKP